MADIVSTQKTVKQPICRVDGEAVATTRVRLGVVVATHMRTLKADHGLAAAAAALGASECGEVLGPLSGRNGSPVLFVAVNDVFACYRVGGHRDRHRLSIRVEHSVVCFGLEHLCEVGAQGNVAVVVWRRCELLHDLAVNVLGMAVNDRNATGCLDGF